MFVSLALARASESLLIIGASAFLPIYIENQFMLTPRKAATLSGNSSAQCTHFEILCKAFLYVFMKYFKNQKVGVVMFAEILNT